MPRTLLLLAAALVAPALSLAEAQPYHFTQTSSAELKIEAALKSPTQLEFIDTPLQDVVDFLKDFHRIEIQVDRNALDDVGLDASTIPMTKNLKGLSLRSALNLVLRDHALTYVVQDEVLLVTTPEAAAGRLTTKVYLVSSVVGSQKNPNEGPAPYHVLIQVITSTVDPNSWANAPKVWYGAMGGMGGMGMGGMGGGYGGPAAAPPEKAEAGRKGSIAGASFGGTPVLVVSQTYHVHRQIVVLLEELRGAAGIKQPAPAKAVKKPAPPAPPKTPPKTPPKATPKPPQKTSSAPAADPFGDEPAIEPPVKPEQPAAADPFGGESSAKPAADPFGDETAKKAPAPRPASKPNDPFSR